MAEKRVTEPKSRNYRVGNSNLVLLFKGWFCRAHLIVFIKPNSVQAARIGLSSFPFAVHIMPACIDNRAAITLPLQAVSNVKFLRFVLSLIVITVLSPPVI